MTLPKLLQQVEITASNNTIAYDLGGGAVTKSITVATYDTVLEALANLDTALGGTFTVACSSKGIVTISNTSVWTVTWGSTDSGFISLFGFSGSETVAHVGSDYILTATNRHLYGFYCPIGLQWPTDRRVARTRVQETDAGGLSQIASSVTHRYRDLQFGLLSDAQLVTGGSDDDGYGSTISWTSRALWDFWTDTRDKHFRFYEDPTTGTVASPGTEGTTFFTCRRMDTEWAPTQRDPGDYSFFDLTIPVKITGE